MMPARKAERLIDHLPGVRGRLSENVPLAGITWFRVGGRAEVMFRPADRDDLATFLAAKPADVPVTVIGVGSNLLVRDGGIPGVTIRLARGFTRVEAEDYKVFAGAGALDLNVALTSRDADIAGLEFFSGIPGTIGGALRMNAGAFECETKDVLISAEAVDEKGRVQTATCTELGMSYRHSKAPANWIFTSAWFQGRPGTRQEIIARLGEITGARKESQPIRARTGGSTFTNPTGARAWELIDEVGCRGLRRGGAMVSEIHCNFLINTGNASAADLEGLGEEVRRRVAEKCGVTLDWEIRRIGIPPTNTPAEVAQ